jgi:MscS family membrane protein
MASLMMKRARWLLFGFALSAVAYGQSLLPSTPKPADTTAAPAQADPLGRDTPSGSVFGFLQAAQSGNFSIAAQYLQMSNARRIAQGEELSAQLKTVIDRAYVGNIRKISTDPAGTPQEGVPLDQQNIGVLSAGDAEQDLILVHVTAPSGNRIWLFSSATLEKVPDLYDQLQVRQVETRLPTVLVKNQFVGMPLWQWITLLLGVPFAAAVGWLVIQLFKIPRQFWLRGKPEHRSLWLAIKSPLWLVISVMLHGYLVHRLRMPLLHRHYYQIAFEVVFVSGVSWLVWRIVQQLLRRLRERAIYAGRSGTGSVMLLGERILKVIVILIAALLVLNAFGFNMTTALAGLGIGGIAVAFAAQKTLENLFGGVSVLGDEVIRVGDVCRFGDRVGTIEDISLRSTRIRTPERTELSIPNGSLATMNIENLTRRDKILFNPKLGLRCETTADQLRYVLAQIRRMLYEHPKVETEGARVRFTSLDSSQLSLDIFCYILTRDNSESLAIGEDLLLRIMDIVQTSGTDFAFPSQTLYLGRDKGLDQQKSSAAARLVQEWRENSQLPFPDFAPSEISQFSNSLPYPQPESAVRSRK